MYLELGAQDLHQPGGWKTAAATTCSASTCRRREPGWHKLDVKVTGDSGSVRARSTAGGATPQKEIDPQSTRCCGIADRLHRTCIQR